MRSFVLITNCLLITNLSAAQTTASFEASEPSYVRLVMFDGTSRMGELIELSDSEIVIETMQLGVVRVPKYLVKGMSNLATRNTSSWSRRSKDVKWR